MIAVCIVSMIFGIVWQAKDSDAYYLCLESDDLDYKYPNGGCESSNPSSILTIFTFATLYNNFVCISMYVSLEMVYICQAYFLCQDLNIYDPGTDTPAECNTSGMCADLGQVQYVLSDKTGTLTKNQMVVQCISLGKRVYGETNPTNDEETTIFQQKLQDTEFHDHLPDIREILTTTATSTSSDLVSSNTPALQPMTPFENHLLLQFMRVLVYCNTAMIMPDEQGRVQINSLSELQDSLQAESPDEVALILSAAQDCGVLLHSRNTTQIISRGMAKYYPQTTSPLRNIDAEEIAEILAVNEFDSDRKMMSIVVRITEASDSTNSSKSNKNGRVYLLCKGADSSVLRHLDKGNPQNETYLKHVKDHIELFANTGLRTLLTAYRELSEDELRPWLSSYTTASNSITNRKEAMQACATEIERDMLMIGALGIEDELQDHVGDSIRLLHDAGKFICSQ